MRIKHYKTKDFSRKGGVEPSTIYRSHCLKGHYLGVRPIKLPNGHLRWPGDKVDRLFGEEVIDD